MTNPTNNPQENNFEKLFSLTNLTNLVNLNFSNIGSDSSNTAQKGTASEGNGSPSGWGDAAKKKGNLNTQRLNNDNNLNKSTKNLNTNSLATGSKQEIVSVTYEEIGLFPRSFSRVLDRFLKQVFSDVENLVIQEYRFYRYLFLTTVRCLFILFFVPFLVNFFAKNYLIHPLTEYFWNTKQTEIFLNSYQQKRAFAELKEFEEKLYFESLIHTSNQNLSKIGFFGNSGLQTNETNAIIGATATLDILTQSNDQLSKSNSEISGITSNQLNINKFETQNHFNSELSSGLTSPLNHDITNEVAKNLNMNTENILNNKNQNSLGSPNLILPSPPNLNSQISLNVSNNINQKSQNLSVEELKDSSINWGTGSKTLEGVNNVGLSQSLYPVIDVEPVKTQIKPISVQESQKQKLQEKIIEIAARYNEQSIEAITNFFADLLSLMTLFYLLFALEIQINITKSFLLEVFFGLDDSKKSLFILLVTDLLVGYHSSNIWELFFEFIFNHYGLPESQTGIFLLVATLPVLLDVLFKYLIFRHLNRSSPATVATYHAMIE